MDLPIEIWDIICKQTSFSSNELLLNTSNFLREISKPLVEKRHEAAQIIYRAVLRWWFRKLWGLNNFQTPLRIFYQSVEWTIVKELPRHVVTTSVLVKLRTIPQGTIIASLCTDSHTLAMASLENTTEWQSIQFYNSVPLFTNRAECFITIPHAFRMILNISVADYQRNMLYKSIIKTETGYNILLMQDNSITPLIENPRGISFRTLKEIIAGTNSDI